MKLLSKELLLNTENYWTPAEYNSNLGNSNWSIIFNDGTQFIALSEYGYISTSADGKTWADATMSYLVAHLWKDVAYNGDYYVAIGYTGYISTSTDGLNWQNSTQVANLGSHNWQAIGYDFNNSQFVALGETGYVSTSSDGTTWSQASQISNLGNNTWDTLYWNGSSLTALSKTGYISFKMPSYWTSASRVPYLGSHDWKALVSYSTTSVLALGSSGYTSVSLTASGGSWNEAKYNGNLGDNDWVSVSRNNKYLVALSSTGYISTKRI